MIRIVKDRATPRKVEVLGSIVTLVLLTKAEDDKLRLDHTQMGPVGGSAKLLPEYFSELQRRSIKAVVPFGDEDGERPFTPADVEFLDQDAESAILKLLLNSAAELGRRVKDEDGVYREPAPTAVPEPAPEVVPEVAGEKKASGDGTPPG